MRAQAKREAASGEHFLKYHVVTDATFNVMADRAAAPGEQLFEDYGDNPTSMYVPPAPLPLQLALPTPFPAPAPSVPDRRALRSLPPPLTSLPQLLPLPRLRA